MILPFITIGIGSGLMLGITGAGGGIIAIPMLIYLVGMSLKQATAVSLVIVFTSALLSWITQRKNSKSKISVELFLFSVVGAAAVKPLKGITPEWVIALLFTSVAAYSMYSSWKKKKAIQPSAKHRILKSSIGGIIMGSMVTMAGVSGGVILIPLLTKFFHLSMNEAAATSLLTITLTAAFSSMLQFSVIHDALTTANTVGMVIGCVTAAIASKKLIEIAHPTHLEFIRKFTLSILIIIAITTVWLKVI